MTIRRALLSVTDKTGLVDLARFLDSRGVELISTGGTAAALAAEGLPVTPVSEITGFPEILDGRVKTLHPAIHGGILGCRDAADHIREMSEHGIRGIDLVVVNLYAFEDVVARGADWSGTIEAIDIGGVALLRAAAKNHAFVTVMTDPEDYPHLVDEMEQGDGATSGDFRLRMAGIAYQMTAAYDTAVATRFLGESNETFPRRLTVSGRLDRRLRYGENPHQAAAYYHVGSRPPRVTPLRQDGGKDLSYNNLSDADAALEAVAEFDPDRDGPAVVIVKHTNPCGVALGDSLIDAYRKALACDSLSAFGGVVAANQPLDQETAQAITGIFTEVVIAPGASDAARGILEGRKNPRLLLADGPPTDGGSLVIRSAGSGLLAQSADRYHLTADDMKVVTRRRPDAGELDDMLFAFRVVKHVRSNAIVYARNGQTLGIGAGQMSRVDSAMIARQKAGRSGLAITGSVVASDAFFPFADGLLEAAEGGATAVIQPGGSVRDEEVIAAADAHDMAMVMTGVRHFRH
ncbi:MAG: bifunctional phosphoribosylaminoimidazolecarboxamide formyltransferase/IMP cyclohydrolase [bacterium]|nr:bifunctional phosphoribosylaminoimidazolecarboxamide formyltransferase/IMP cyclohydrolase [bacterium]